MLAAAAEDEHRVPVDRGGERGHSRVPPSTSSWGGPHFRAVSKDGRGHSLPV